MPNIKRIFLAKFIIFFTLSLQSINCQANTEKLNFADSLFQVKSYQEAYNIYKKLLQEDGVYSPAMLLKMAYITEGMGQNEEATLYLSKYYDHNPNTKVISKIKSLTDQSDLKGYDISDRAQFFRILTDYRQSITSALALLLIISLIIPIAKKGITHTKYFIPSFILLFLTFFVNNFLHEPRTGVIKGSPTIIMDQPTAAGRLIEKVNPGHRVTIKSSEDIWYQIEWEGKKAFVKKEKVAQI